MKLNIIFKGLLLATIVVFSSCSDDIAINQVDDCSVDAPTSYSYKIDGNSTVSYTGQSTRLEMANQILSALSDGTTTEDMLTKMFNHQANDIDFNIDSLDVSSKKLKNKTATAQGLASTEQDIHTKFQLWFADYGSNVAPAIAANDMAAPNVAGFILNRELNSKGMEYDQIVAKSLIGALCLDQVVNGYLSAAKIGDAVNNTERTESNNSTLMEHHWDEGFGYVYGADSDISDETISGDNLLGKYLQKYDAERQNVYNAFVLGRQAIVENCSEERDRQAQIIKENLSQVVAKRAITYLEEAASYNNNYSADYFHALSEGYGFILSLQFTCDADGFPYFTNSEVNVMLNQLEEGNGFWDRTSDELNTMATSIKTVTGL